MVELTRAELFEATVTAFALGVIWQIVFARVLTIGRKEVEKLKKPTANGWKPKVLSNGMEVEISWTSHPSWRPEESARGPSGMASVAQSKTLRESRNWGAE